MPLCVFIASLCYVTFFALHGQDEARHVAVVSPSVHINHQCHRKRKVQKASAKAVVKERVSTRKPKTESRSQNKSLACEKEQRRSGMTQ